MSNQCIACPHSTASTDESGSGIASALPCSGTRPREPAAQLAEHVRVRLDRGNLRAQAEQHLGQLAGARPQVQHPQAGQRRLGRAGSPGWPSAQRTAACG